MNSYLNITVRVLTKAAQAALAQLDGSIRATSKVASTSGYGASAIGAANKSLRSLGTSFQWAGYQLRHAFTIPLALAGGAALKYELDNEKAFANIKKVYGDTALQMKLGTAGMMAELNALKGEFVALSDVYGQSQTDVLNIAEAWAAAGVSGRALGSAVENTLKTMVIGDLDAVTSTKALISIQAQFGASSSDLTKIMAALNTTENITGATMGDLIIAFQRSAGTAHAAGVSYKELAAMVSALTPAAGTGTQAGNALKSIFVSILKPTKQATEAMKEMGINASGKNWNALSTVQKLGMLSAKYKDLTTQQKIQASGAIVGKYQISRFNQLLADMGKSFDKNGKLIKSGSGNLGYFGKALDATSNDAANAKVAQQELNTVLESNPQKLKQMWTILKNDAASAVARLIPLIIHLVTMLASITRWFSNLSPATQKWIGVLILGLALLGPLILYLGAIIQLMHFLQRGFGLAEAAGKGLFNIFRGKPFGGAAAAAADAEAAAKTTTEKMEEIYLKFAQKLEEMSTQLAASMEAATSSAATAQVTAAETAAYKQEAAMQAASAAQIKAARAAASEAVAAQKAAQIAIVQAETQAATIRATEIEDFVKFNATAATDIVGVYRLADAEIARDAVTTVEAMTAVWVAGAEGIQAAFIPTAVFLARLNGLFVASAAYYSKMAAGEWAAQQATNEALYQTLTVMRETMTLLPILGDAWTAEGLMAQRSVDAATAAIMIENKALESQMALLATLIVSAEQYSKVMLTASAASSLPAVIPATSKAVVATRTIEHIPGEAAGAASAAKVAQAGAAAAKVAEADAAAAGAASVGIVGRSWAAITGLFARAGKGILSGVSFVFRGILNVIGAAFSGIWRLVTKIPLIGPILSGLGSAIATVFTTIAAVVGLPVEAVVAIVLAVIAVFLIFRHQITALFSWVADQIVKLAKWIWDGLKSIGQAFEDAAKWVINSMIALPGAIVQIMKAVVSVIAEAAKEVYELFSYLNPFAHHSPSLVENVENGMDRIARKFAGITSISGPIKKAYADIKVFGQAIAGLIKSDAELKAASDIKLLSKYAPAAVAEYKVLQADLADLTIKYNKLGDALEKEKVINDAYQKQVDAITYSLSVQQNKLDELTKTQTDWSNKISAANDTINQFASDGITGMQAMSDAIFNNDQAQKSLQLQMLKMEDVLGPIDDANSKLSTLAGQIEQLRGEESSLRAAGAGSDVLKGYDQQIAALQQQTNSTTDQIAAYDKMGDELKALQHQADELNLEQSLQFDPLTRQIEKLTKATNELPFSMIVAGITSTQQKLAGYTDEYNKATVAVNAQQKVVDDLTTKQKAAQAVLDAEQQTLNALQDAYSKTGDAIQAITDKMDLATQSANNMASAMSASGGAGGKLLSGGGSIGGGLGDILGRDGGLGSQIDGINKDTQSQLDKLKNKIGNLDLFGGLKKKFKDIGDWIKKWIWDEPAKWGDWITEKVKGLGKKLWGWVSEGISDIGTWIAQGWNNLVSAIQTGWNSVVTFLEGLPSKILDFFKDAPKWLLHAGEQIMYGLGYGIGYAIGFVLRFIIGLPMKILGLLKDAGKWLIGPGKDAIGGFLWGLIKKIPDLLMWFVSLPGKIGTWIGDAAQWLIVDGGKALGGFLWGLIKKIPDLLAWFVSLPGKIGTWIGDAGQWLIDTGKNIIGGLLSGLGNGIKAVWDWITSFIKGFINGFKKALGINSPSTVFFDLAKDILQGLLNGLVNAALAVGKWFLSLPGMILGWIGDAAKWLWQKGKDILQGLWNGIVDVFKNLGKWFTEIPGAILKALGNVGMALFNAGKALLQGFWNGMKSIGSAMISWAKNTFDTVTGFLSDATLEAKTFGTGGGGASQGSKTKNAWDIYYNPKTHLWYPSKQQAGLNYAGTDYFKGGLTWVGERGPELMNLPRGSQIMSYNKSMDRIIDSAIKAASDTSVSINARVSSAMMTRLDKMDQASSNKLESNSVHNETHITFTGDLSFPNVKNGDDAEDFLSNLLKASRSK